MQKFFGIRLKLLLFAGCSIVFYAVDAQDFSNAGKDFWVGYGSHVAMYNPNGTINDTSGGTQDMVLYFTSNKNASIKVEIPATGWVRYYTLTANTVVESDSIPKAGADDARLTTEGVSNKGIHITSDQPVVAYCHIYNASVSGAALLFPTNILGQDYYTLNYTQISNDANCYSYCFVIATEDSTLVEITPFANTLTHAAGQPFTQLLNKGQILNLLGKPTGQNGVIYTGVDLTGTHIRTVNTGNVPCKKIAVFCGSGKVNIMCGPGLPTSDNMIQQMFPSDAWGTKYITIPTKDMPLNFFRIMVKDTIAVVKVNGVTLNNLINGRYYTFAADSPCVITADTSILVAQYITTEDQCGNTVLGENGDPEMIYLSPVDQNISNITVNSTSHYAITIHHINVLIRTTDVNSFRLDGNAYPGSFKILNSDPEYSYAQFTVNAGFHNLRSDSGFNAVAYGYGYHESYGYNAGFNISHLYNYLTVHNPYATPNTLQACRATPFKLSVALVYQPTEMQWDFLGNPNLSPNSAVDIKNPLPDSSFTQDGKMLFRYTLPGFYNFSATGKLHVDINVFNSLQDGCSSQQPIGYDIDVVERPLANWHLDYNKCVNDTLFFKDSSDAFSNNIIHWYWDFGDGSFDTTANPVKKYAVYGDYNTALQIITDIGCFDDTVKPVSLSTYPFANFTVNPLSVCQGAATKFTDASSISYGAITKWQWDFGNGGSINTQSPSLIYPQPGIYNVKLSVYNKNGCEDDTIHTAAVYAYPTISISDLFVYEGNSIQIKPDYTGTGLQYRWSPSIYLNSDTAAYPVSTPFDDIRYYLTVTGSGGCTATKTVFIDVVQLLTIPNVFSPNGDGINDKWIITNLEFYPTADVEIFNRYGQPVFHSLNYFSKPWDGTYNGSPMPVGTYYYIINTKNKYIGVKSGYVAILR